MTSHHNDVTIRPITGPEELDLFNQLPYQLNDELAGDLDSGHRRPEWLWVALRDGRLAARTAWWARAGTSNRTPWTSSISMTRAARKPWTSRHAC